MFCCGVVIEGPDVNVLESVFLQSSELTRCEWCTVKKLPVLFLQTTDEECQRLRTQLQMFRDEGGIWYDSSGNSEYQNVTVNVSLKAKYAISAVLVSPSRITKIKHIFKQPLKTPLTFIVPLRLFLYSIF